MKELIKNWKLETKEDAEKFRRFLLLTFKLSFCLAEPVETWKVVPYSPFRGVNPLFPAVYGEEMTRLVEIRRLEAVKLLG